MGTDDSSLPGYLRYWGKARPNTDAQVAWHPLAYHCLDVAAVAAEILRNRPTVLGVGARLLGLAEDEALDLVPALVALHDVGKCANTFQHLVPELAGHVERRAGVAPVLHTSAGLALWRFGIARHVCDGRGWGDPYDIDVLAEAVFGHHGRPVSPHEILAADRGLRVATSGAARAAARELSWDLVAALTTFSGAIPGVNDSGRRASWWLAGIVTLADWIGSVQRWFPYERPVRSVGSYLAEIARGRARTAVREAGIVSPRPRSVAPVEDLLGPGRVATPTQDWTQTVPLPGAGPVLAVIEDVTGSGKTEAAQILAARLLSADRASGVYWAMPTQATANAMYMRQASAIGHLYEPGGEMPSLVLAHGQARLVPAFRHGLLDAATEHREDSVTDSPEDAAASTCAAWLAHDRRVALLADVGAGTIDQAILAALPNRFCTMRLLGLVGKVLVLDEVHAYDTYVTEEIAGLLEFAGAMGTSVILLSATLPVRRREELRSAWLKGAGLLSSRSEPNSISGPVSIAYPRVSLTAADGVENAKSVGSADRSRRRVSLGFVSSVEDAVRRVVSEARSGCAVGWVRNTVKACLDAADAVRAAGFEAIVFHSRFAQGDRQRIEEEVLRRLGPEGATGRCGTIVIATQVIEQSLDIDFDAVVSDLAPVDLVLQRAGRLWRHRFRNASRPNHAREELVLLAPATIEDEAAAEWLAALPSGDRYVYEPAILWLSHQLLKSVSEMRVPDDVRDFVEYVYDPARIAGLSGLMEKLAIRAQGEAAAAKAVAYQSSLAVDAGYSRAMSAWTDEAQVRTRLGEDSVTLRLATRGRDGVLQPWHVDPSRTEIECWRLSEVKVRAALVPRDACHSDPQLARAADALRASWGRFDRDCIPAVLDPGREEGRGVLMDSSGNAISLEYSARTGLRVTRKSA